MTLQTTIARVKRALVIMLGDLTLLTSLYLAHFMVWRTIRTRYQERLARLRNMRLINGTRQALSGNHTLRPVDGDDKGKLREALRDCGVRRRG